MCGILGLLDPAGVRVSPETGAAALARLRRRGPDDEGVWQEATIWLGHRRLAVVDPSPAGHQPMRSADGRYLIVFNGEIYNHRDLRRELSPPAGWRGTSDTETLLEAYRTWGAECLSRLNGMFAFAIWDRTLETLFLARDRIGVKPLYYSTENARVAFASRPGALLTLRGGGDFVVDPEALRVYLELGFVPPPLSFHRGVRRLEPGHYLIAGRGAGGAPDVRIRRYWDFRMIAPERAWLERPEGELVEELDGLIRDAVAIRLLSDVPLGAFLSGGVDSALVVAAMRAAGVDAPQTFTIGFEEAAYDESAAAAAIARHLGVSHVHERLAVDSLIDLLPAYLDEFDEPFADSSAFPTMAVARLARRHVTVALSGDGADELFGGYHYYPLMERLAPALKWREGTRRAAAALLRRAPAHRLKLLAGALHRADAATLFAYLRGIGKDYPALISAELAAGTDGGDSWFEQSAAGFAMDLGAAETAMRLDTAFTLPGLFLQKVDLATMAFSLEARCPMTDYRLVEWAMRLPLAFKLRGGVTKYLLKKVLCKYLPPAMVSQPKRGFGVPIAAWLRGPLRGWAEGLIHDDRLIQRVHLDAVAVRALLRQHLRGERDAHPLLWSVLMLLCHAERAAA
ncbi:MAG: asparagine synthase (glutamine-hydrolyzing) [Gammaproteobacteria bacterium]|nr:asparagine synthase (glutamine-hydrolyzing) [Gammaproteobacteria bacterium]